MEKHYSHSNIHKNSQAQDIRLYHKDVEIPDNIMNIAKGFIENLSLIKVELSRHVLDSINNNQDGASHDYTKDDILEAIRLAKHRVDKLDIFEIGMGKIPIEDKIRLVLRKVCFRINLDTDNDIIIVLGKDGDRVFVKTAWLNDKNDNHKEGFNPGRYYPYTDGDKKIKDYVPPKETLPKKRYVVRRKQLESIFEGIYKETHI